MTIYHFALSHVWWLAGIAGATGVLALVFRRRVARLVRLAKAAATDPRLPAPVRWLFRIGIAAKLWPGPDLGIDELALGLGIVLLGTKYRKEWDLIRADLDSTNQKGKVQ